MGVRQHYILRIIISHCYSFSMGLLIHSLSIFLNSLMKKALKLFFRADWCSWPDSNWHGGLVQRILSPLCLPIPPREHKSSLAFLFYNSCIPVSIEPFWKTVAYSGLELSSYRHLQGISWVKIAGKNGRPDHSSVWKLPADLTSTM